jgi:hypothetical protein
MGKGPSRATTASSTDPDPIAVIALGTDNLESLSCSRQAGGLQPGMPLVAFAVPNGSVGRSGPDTRIERAQGRSMQNGLDQHPNQVTFWVMCCPIDLRQWALGAPLRRLQTELFR